MKKGKPIDPASGEPMDDEWDGASSAERSIQQKNRRKKIEESAIADRIAGNSNSAPQSATPVSRRTPSQMAAARSQGNRVPPRPQAPTTQVLLTGQQGQGSMTEKLFNQKVQMNLLKHKEQLKRDISKKRSMQEKELTLDIKRDIEKIKGSPPGKTVMLTASSPPSLPVPVPVNFVYTL